MTDSSTPSPGDPDRISASINPPRRPSAADEIAESYLESYAGLDPIAATAMGVAGHDAELPELTPDWLQSLSQLRRLTLRSLRSVHARDATDVVTISALTQSLDVAEQLRGTGRDEADLNVIESPSQSIRDCFDLMPTATPDDWATIATRLGAVPKAIDGYLASLRLAASRGEVSAQRQVAAVVKQCDANGCPDGFFGTFAANAVTSGGAQLPATLRAELAQHSALAAAAYGALAEALRAEILPLAPVEDAVGAERYALCSRAFLGTRIDLAETYAWGQAELARITAEMTTTAERIKPGSGIRAAMESLDADPSRKLHGTGALQAWMQRKSDDAIEMLADTHFDIPPAIRTLECRIAPTQTGGIYYTGPSDDLVTRPGRMWWSVPAGVTEFSTWRELTTVYHEGVPGHHLQIAQTVYRRELLNKWRRLGSWISGHGEGWALYAENLMAELGYLDDPADYLGMLDGQSLRAARVVIDIGVHCGFEAPTEVGGGAWTYDKAWTFLTAHAVMPEPVLRFELDRYLGWPGQAPAYKIGERFWLQLRADVAAREGAGFDLKAFHRRALDIGSVGLDVLRDAVLREN